MFQRWVDLLFMHWPVPAETLRPKIPAGLELDVFEGRAWVGVVPFGITGLRPRFLPPLPYFSNFPELNMRTYVRHNGKPGVWFFSLDAGNFFAVWGARFSFHLSYFHARMRCAREGERVVYGSRRIHSGAREADFKADYAPTGAVFHASPGSLDYFLTERYCLYSADGRGNLYRADIDHLPWPLQRAEAEVQTNTMARASGIELPETAPLLHFAARQDVRIWAPERI
jgi:uncharacterized protein YqjF (DUF2071 family)